LEYLNPNPKTLWWKKGRTEVCPDHEQMKETTAMETRSEEVEELLWDLDEYYPDHPTLEDAWEAFNEEGDVPAALYKKLKRMLNRAVSKGAAA
jgi:hypothetical protein